jgi:carbon storage regulator
MLVLSRRKSEQIVIDDRIVITVLATKGNSVRLGIDAPNEVPVHRAEVQQQIEIETADFELAELAY